LKKVGELSTRHFIGTDNKCNVVGLILGGSADFKAQLEKSEVLDQRL
jgi:peptide chain release factor subunit 1